MYWDTQKHYSITLLVIATKSACPIRAIKLSGGAGAGGGGGGERGERGAGKECRSLV